MVSGYGNGTVGTRDRSNGLAVAGLVCGVIGIFLFNIILGPLALIFGGVARSKAQHGATHRTMALAAIVLGVVDIALFVVLMAVASSGHGFTWHVG